MHKLTHRAITWKRPTSLKRSLSTSNATNAPSQDRSATDNLGVAVFTSICLGAFGLGCWQTKRYLWKVDVMDEQRKRYLQEPETIPEGGGMDQHHVAELVQSLKGRRISVTGTFLHDKEVLIGPRSAPAGLIGTAAQGLAINPQGYYVITPLQRGDGTVFFINRGWVPLSSVVGGGAGRNEVFGANSNAKVNVWDRPKGTTSVSTVVSGGEVVGRFSPVNNPSTKKLFWIEPKALVEATGLQNFALPTIILESVEYDDVPVTFYPANRRLKHLDEQYITPMTHLVYAVTWFSLSLAGLVMTFYKFKKPPKINKRVVGGGGASAAGGGAEKSS